MARGKAGTDGGTGADTRAAHRVEIALRGKRRRSVGAEENARLVAVTFQPGATIQTVSRRQGICTSEQPRSQRAAGGAVLSRRAAPPRLLPTLVVATNSGK